MKYHRWCVLVLMPFAMCLAAAWPSSAPPAEKDGPEEEAKQAAQQLDLYTANLFHKRLSAISKGGFVAVEYDGPLSHPRKPAGVDLLETADYDLLWAVTDVDEHGIDLGRLLFKIRVSLKKEPDTVAECIVNEKRLYLQVTDLPEKWTVDTELPRGDEGMTIRKLLKRVADEK